jgi:hypothetical protein
MNPPSDLVSQIFHRGLLPLGWSAVLALQAYLVLAVFSPDPLAGKVFPLAAGGLCLALWMIYWYGAEGQLLHFNVDMGLTDQSAYLDYVRRLAESGYTYPGDFNRMPVYPFLLSLALDPGMTDAEFFHAAKYFNLFLSFLLLGVLAVIFLRRFPPISALTLILIVTFSLFVYKAGWVQAELSSRLEHHPVPPLVEAARATDYATAVAAGPRRNRPSHEGLPLARSLRLCRGFLPEGRARDRAQRAAT